MRVLITALVPSHLMAMVPVAWALRAAGHEVLVAGGDAVVERAAAAGISGVRVSEPPGPRVKRSAAPSGLPGAEPDWSVLRERWRQRVDGIVDEHLTVARAFGPQLVITDPIEFSGLIVAGVLGVPAVVHRWGPDRISSRSIPLAIDTLTDIAVRRGAENGPARPALTLDPCPPSLQCPEAAPATPVRFIPFNGAGTPPDWAAKPPTGRRVCVSFGGETKLLNDPDVWETLTGELAALSDTETVVTAVPAGAGPLPPSVRAPGAVPLDLFLGGCDGMVHHGGAGTALTGLAFGVPQLILAQPNPSWLAVGERLEACDAGAVLDLDAALRTGRQGELGAALADLLSDPRPKQAATALAEEIQAQPSPAELVPELVALAAAG
ncbi:DUF1205 domain-containing protein [Streptomyces sp. 3MP-14]|uniref:DUF1205 domain-containing protein n=1 Tax=Streptomyces mimosae TaxID=2586635 RepID=A0A5N6AMI3_9ACTN|nr:MULTISPECIES: nucleotide disphospho-sugar-binding domain-containing protein [Streptomyces]KAB8169891.1 DUF1205 domain-containing protein [Streptomyces mimosae]KAB8178639.1 DUF1205 domain-containing protein [Streptomyces sp. 3MP-14]